MRVSIFTIVFVCLIIGCGSREDILIADFEGDGYGNWIVEGEAFGSRPATGTLPDQQKVSGFLGKGLVNSYLGGDETTGRLLSPKFTLERDFLNFLIAGGPYEKETVMRLWLRWDDGEWEIIRTATGPPHGSETLRWDSWDISVNQGMTAYLEILDAATGDWGHINVDHIIQSDESLGVDLENYSRVLPVEHSYLHFPVHEHGKERLVSVSFGGEKIYEFDLQYTCGEPDFWAYLDVREFKGNELVLTCTQIYGDLKNTLDLVTTGDEPRNHETFYMEKLRPQFHYSPPRGWNNDPNGMVYYEGEYHLFYQHNPYGWHWGNMTWGHAVSRDMLHWENLSDAIHPDQMGTIFSGTAVIDYENTSGFKNGEEAPLICFFTYAGETSAWSVESPFTQAIAYSTDRGRTFTKFEGNPIIGHIRGGNRDPKVTWYEPGGHWVMVLFIEEDEMAFFISQDLKNWEETSRLKSFHECPELFELPVDGDETNMKWVLYGASGHYFIGEFDGRTFTPDGDEIRYHYGDAWYASQTFNDIPEEDSRRIQIGWAQTETPGMPFNQSMSFPVTLRLQTTEEGVRLLPWPIQEIETLYRSEKRYDDLTLMAADDLLSNYDAGEYDLKLDVELGGAESVTLKIRDREMVYDIASEVLYANEEARAPLKARDGRIQLRILIDRTYLEIFANQGERFLPVAAIPYDHYDRDLSLNAEGGNPRVRSLVIREMNSIW